MGDIYLGSNQLTTLSSGSSDVEKVMLGSTLVWTSTSGTTVWSGLTGYWNFNEISGTTVADSLGNNDGTANNAALLTSEFSGITGNSGDFSAGNYNVNLGTDDDFNPDDGAYSWSFWIYGRPSTTASRVLIAKSNGGSASTGYGYQITAFSFNELSIAFATSTATHFIRGIAIADVPETQWNHIVCTLASTRTANTDFKLYLNGSLGTMVQNRGLMTSNNGDITSTRNLMFGSESDNQFYLDVAMDEVAMWKGIELTTSQVTELYNSGSGKFYS